MSLTKIAEKTFKADLVLDRSIGSTELGRHESTMTLYSNGEPGGALIEWVIPSLDMVEHIGLSFDARKKLLDYDGVFSLPKEAVSLLRKAGFRVPKDFE